MWGYETAKRLQFALGVLISAAALYLVLRDVHWAAVSQAIGNANVALIVLAVACFLGTVLLRAVRWRLLLAPLPGLRLWDIFGCLNVAYFINNLLPFQMGDLGRSYLLSEIAGISATRAFSTVVVERILDVFTLLLLLLCLAPFVAIPAWARAPSLTLAVLFTTLAVVLVLASLQRPRAQRFSQRLLRLAPARSRPKLSQMIENALDGVAVLAKPRLTLRLLALSFVIWLALGGILFLGMKALNVGTGYDAALFVMIATTFGIFVPSSPGAFGVYHAIAIGVLTSVFDVEKNVAVSYALVIHLMIYLPPIAVATLFLWLERARWRRGSIFRKLSELASPAPASS